MRRRGRGSLPCFSPGLLFALVLGINACGGGGAGEPLSPFPPVPGVVQPHWDQVCWVDDRTPAALTVSELFDTVGLGSDLAAVTVEPAPVEPPWPTLDFISLYDARGRVIAVEAWDESATDPAARPLAEVLRSRASPLPPLLATDAFHTVVTLGPHRTARVEKPVLCMPHPSHDKGARLIGLPDGVTVWSGTGRLRMGDDSTSVVRILIGRDGSIAELDFKAGTADARRAVEGLIWDLRFQPALRNGIPIAGELTEAFRFRRWREWTREDSIG